MSIMRLGCLAVSLIALIPTLLIGLVLAFVLTYTGLAPGPVADLVGGLERPIAKAQLQGELTDVEVRSVELNKQGTRSQLTVVAWSRRALPAPETFAKTALRSIGSRLDTPFGLARQVSHVRLVLQSGDPARGYIGFTVSTEDAQAYASGQINDRQLARRWRTDEGR